MKDRPLDEVFDVQQDVEQNPCGALMAIHSQATEIERLRDALKKMCRHWDEHMNNVDCGEEFDDRQDAERLLKKKEGGDV